ncbi:hypothetical protein GCM10027088_18290 [Nocardia goodfellowii]
MPIPQAPMRTSPTETAPAAIAGPAILALLLTIGTLLLCIRVGLTLIEAGHGGYCGTSVSRPHIPL